MVPSSTSIRSAIWEVAFSTAAVASHPNGWLRLLALPGACVKYGIIASNTNGSTGVVALCSKYISVPVTINYLAFDEYGIPRYRHDLRKRCSSVAKRTRNMTENEDFERWEALFQKELKGKSPAEMAYHPHPDIMMSPYS